MGTANGTRFDLEPLAPAMGVRVEGLDLRVASRDAADLASELRAVLLEHHLLVVSGQDLRGEELQAFGSAWGELLTHPASMRSANPRVQTLASRQGARGRGYGAWHSDMSWHPTPPWITMLHARTLPAWGGDTGFANQHLAFEALDTAAKDRGRMFRRDLPTSEDIAHLSANHTGKRFGAHVPDSVHPLVRLHDESGRLALYANPEFTSHIVGMEEAASALALYSLWAHATGLEFTYRHHWRPGDLAIWDNRSLMHTSILDYDEPRALIRVVVKGEAVRGAEPQAGG